MQINKLLQTVINRNASDLHLAVGRKPCIRLSSRLVELNTKVLDNDDTTALMKSITSDRCQQELQEVGSTDFGFSFGEQARFRVSVFKQRGNIGIVLRLIPNRLMTFEEIGLPPQVRDMLYKPRGLVLVTGPTGSGKTTTLATMINHINESRDCHIITIEDPVEYHHKHIRSIVTQREIGVDTPGFAEGLRRGLRMDPDVILIGEMRDLETIETAIHSSETGHLVFGTLHTTGAAETVNRVIDQFPAQQQEQIRVMLSTTLISVISQTLIPRASGQGVVAAFEILMINSAIQNLIRTKKTYQIDSEIQTGSKFGMVTLDDHLMTLVKRRIITAQEAILRCRNIQEFKHRLEGIAEVDETEAAIAVSAAAGGEGAAAKPRPSPARPAAPAAPAQRPAQRAPASGKRPVLQIDPARQKRK